MGGTPKLCPYFKRRRFMLYHGDCLEILPLIPAESIDMVFADPPYGLSNNGMTCRSGKMVSVNKGAWDRKIGGPDEQLQFHLSWINACKRVLKPNGTIWISGTFHSIYATGYALQVAGFHILNDIVWFKPNGAPNLGRRTFTHSHETLLWAKKAPKAKHWFDYDFTVHGQWPKDILKTPNRQMRSVWGIPTTGPSEKLSGRHPTQKPLSLLSRIILATTKVGDTILDPFSGSSTTGLVATAERRSFIGIEKSKKYLNLSIRRFQAIT